MALILMTKPATEPLSLADAKRHLRVDDGVDDAFINGLITTSRLHVEAALGIALITQGWRLQADAWVNDSLTFPIRPVQSIQAVHVYDAEGVANTIEAGAYLLDASAAMPRLVATSSTLPRPGRASLGIDIEFIAGFGDDADDVPGTIRQALAMLVAHWYEHREAVTTGERGARIPIGVSDLLAPYRLARL